VKLENGWTGGQFSLLRGTLGVYLAAHFAALVPWAAELFSDRGMLLRASDSPLVRAFPNILAVLDSPAVVTGLVVVAALVSIVFAVGWQTRVCALFLWYIWACLLGRNPLISNPGIPFVGWILVATALLRPDPYLSWAARGRADPGGGWRLPSPVYAAAWIVMAVGYTYSGVTKLVSPSWIDGTALLRVLSNPLARPGLVQTVFLGLPPILLALATWGTLALELLYAPLALFRRVRPWIWLAMVLLHLGLVVLVDFADLTAGMLMIHFFTFDPAWVRGVRVSRPEWVFYDGSCGLCHGAVRFALAEDRSGDTFRFAPLHGETFRRIVPASATLPDSLVVARESGELLTRSGAALHILKALGGWWRILGTVAGAVPRPARDAVYDGIARLRHRLFAPPPAACPIVPPALRDRLGA
jgi:predicted DCC family thiol-disulfide oxidoreductase YuxK